MSRRATVAAAVILGVAVGTWLAWRPPGRSPGGRSPGDPSPPSRPGAVECQLDPAPGPRAVSLVEHHPDTLAPLGPLPVAVDGEWLTFRPAHPSGVGRLSVDGFAPASIGWLDGACLDLVALAPTGETRVYGQIVDPSPDLFVTGCDRSVPVGPDGDFELAIEGEPCVIEVGLIFGTQLLRGQEITVRPAPGSALEVTLRPPTPPGDAGWDLLETDDGFRVTAVVPGAPADAAGIAPGDRILRLGDVPGTEFAAEDALVVPLPVDVTLAGTDGSPPRTVRVAGP
jgi:hypothetical protein